MKGVIEAFFWMVVVVAIASCTLGEQYLDQRHEIEMIDRGYVFKKCGFWDAGEWVPAEEASCDRDDQD